LYFAPIYIAPIFILNSTQRASMDAGVKHLNVHIYHRVLLAKRYRDFSCPRPFVPKNEWSLWGTFVLVPETFRPRERKFHGNESSLELSFPALSFSGTFVRSRGTKVPGNFRSQDFSFLRLFYKALAVNADSYSNCQNLFRSRPSSVCFPKIN